MGMGKVHCGIHEIGRLSYRHCDAQFHSKALVSSVPDKKALWYTYVASHYNDVIMGVMASQMTSLTCVYSTVYSSVNQRKHQSSASLAFVRGIHRGQVNSPHKWPVTRKMFPFDDVIMTWRACNDQCSRGTCNLIDWCVFTLVLLLDNTRMYPNQWLSRYIKKMHELG